MILYRGVVLVAYVIFLCNVTISYYHALKWFQEIGDFPGIFAHVAVIGIDSIFAVASWIISNGITRKIRLGFPVWLCFLFGLGITGWSNVRVCLEDGSEGIVAGLAIPAALLCIKLLLSWMTSNKEAFVKTVGHLDTTQVIPDNKPEPDRRSATAREARTDISDIKTDITPVSQTAIIAKPDNRTDTQTDKPETRPDRQPVTTNEEPHVSPVLVAERLAKADGKLPSIRRLSEVAGISRYRAEKTLKQLKAQIAQEVRL